MVIRTAWISRLEEAWTRRSVVWLAGVRRSGKTTLARSLPDVEYFDCELPRVRRSLADAEAFLSGMRGRRVVLDEVHRLDRPAEFLKIAADHFPDTRVLATGSSTLAAAGKFRDSLAGRKESCWLTPMTLRDGEDFGARNPDTRLVHGGLPPFYLAPTLPERDFAEWMDAYWSRDIQDLFRLERRHSFQKFLEMLFLQSGGLFNASSFAGPCEISRQTVTNYLAVLETTFVAHVLRPYHTRRQTELTSMPKVYAFDTGFVCFARGWTSLRPEDRGALWEHLVLNELHARPGGGEVRYWRDKQGHEVDFVLAPRGRPPVAIECKWAAEGFDPRAFRQFRAYYPEARFLLVAADARPGFVRRMEGLEVQVCDLRALPEILDALAKA